MRRGQASLEFVMLISFMMLVFVGFFSLANTQLNASREQEIQQQASDIAERFVEQVRLASLMQDGFARSFRLPTDVDGIAYNIALIDNWEVVVIHQGYEHVEFLSANVTGQINRGLNTIHKRDGLILNP